MAQTNESTPEGELNLIRWIRGQTPTDSLVPIGIGDDCAGVSLPPDQIALLTTDMLIDGVHFRLAETKPERIGHKAIARCLSDVAAMAGQAIAVVVAMAAPKKIPSATLHAIVLGMLDAVERTHVRLVGGDVASGDLPLTITVTALGAAYKDEVPRRNAARENDVILVTGELGGSPLGRHLDFLPRLTEARWLWGNADLHAMIDISDGLATDARHIAEESGVALELWEDAIPIHKDAIVLGERTGRAPLQHALQDGEDYELLFTTTARAAERLLQRADLPVKVTCIGEVTAGSGLWISQHGKNRRPLELSGWEHAF